MNCRRRYCLTLVSFFVVVLLYLVVYSGTREGRPAAAANGGGRLVLPREDDDASAPLFVDDDDDDDDDRGRTFFGRDEGAEEQDMFVSPKVRRQSRQRIGHYHDCRMSNCFNFSLCREGFKVYVYPVSEKISEKYSEILKALRTSRYYTSDPSQACIYVLSIDTLDRDKLSVEFVQNIQSQIDSLKWWRGGVNHVVFNLYSGTWPDYNENGLGFDIGKAMLAKASISELHYRPQFDISFPLFHKEHSYRGGEPGFLTANNVPPVRKYTLVFKGKRYLTGIGSETRNSLYHINNGQDIVLLTTCKHGKGWKNLEDERCEKDNLEYDKWDYKVMLKNSTFCLVPRGRRLGSYRFLESLQAGCIPVLLSNNWVLPFSEVIDWSRAVVWADERLLLQIPTIVRSINHGDILAMRQQTQFLWDTYFSSIEKIVDTTFEILKDRIYRYVSRTSYVWNSVPGALSVLPEYSQLLTDYPFYWRPFDYTVEDAFTAVIYATNRNVLPSSPVYRLIRALSGSAYLKKILILWHTQESLPTDTRWPVSIKVPVIEKRIQFISERLLPFSEIETQAVLSLDSDIRIITDEVNFAFNVWKNFPERIVGYVARSHFWLEGQQQWGYTSKWTSDYSIVLTNAAFYHKYYSYLYTNLLPKSLHLVVNRLQNCEDILMNFLVTHIAKYPPMKLAQKKSYKEALNLETHDAVPSAFKSNVTVWLSSKHFAQRQFCINRFVEEFGYMALQRSAMRFDPLLFKDPVSIVRKRYRFIDVAS